MIRSRDDATSSIGADRFPGAISEMVFEGQKTAEDHPTADSTPGTSGEVGLHHCILSRAISMSVRMSLNISLVPTDTGEKAIAVPLYTWPQPVSAAWETVLDSANVVGFVVLNPDSGPGMKCFEGFKSCVLACQKAGIGVLGYTRSTYGARDLKEVLDDLGNYLEWYDVDGLFVDEVTCGESLQGTSSTRTQIIPCIPCPQQPPVKCVYNAMEAYQNSYEKLHSTCLAEFAH